MTAESSAAATLTSVKKKNIGNSCGAVVVRGGKHLFFYFFIFSAEDSFRKIATGKAAHTEKNITGGDRRVCCLAPLLVAFLL